MAQWRTVEGREIGRDALIAQLSTQPDKSWSNNCSVPERAACLEPKMPHRLTHRSSPIPWLALAALLLLCVARGVWFTHGLAVPTDPDTVRDIGFIRGILDGNAWGDPSIGGAWRWYPPLFHVLAAGVAYLTWVDPLPLWNAAGTWLNLATPAAFFLMNRRLLGPWPAIFATGVMVLFDGAVMGGDEAAGYTPWTYTPALAWPLFFAGVALIHRMTPALRIGGAIAIGCGLGIVFLAHTVPAIVLSGMVAILALSQSGRRRRALMWLAAVGGLELVWAAPFLGPLLFDYRLHIANPVPGAWVHPLFADPGRMLLLSLPALVSAAWLIRARAAAPPGTMPLLLAWFTICLAFLARHAACADGLVDGGVCRVFVVAPHHFHVYLQAAEACITGWALWLASVRLAPRLQPAAAIVGVLAVGMGVAGLFLHPWDQEARAGALANPGAMIDRAAYDWIVAHTRPTDRFVTLLPPEVDQMGPAAATVIAAGRQLVAPPEIHSNPYIAWAPLNAKRLAYLTPGTMAGEQDPAFLLLPTDVASSGQVVFRSADHVIYWVGDRRHAEPPVWQEGPQAATVPVAKPGRTMTDTLTARRARPG